MSLSQSLRGKIPPWSKQPLMAVYRTVCWIRSRIALYSPVNALKIMRVRKSAVLRLNVGCGRARFAGWTNIDIEAGADVVMDLRRPMPFADDSVDLIYCEHVLEHFTYRQGQKMLGEFHRCLKKRGVARIAMPDLDSMIEKYGGDWRDQDWLSWPEYAFIETKGQMINQAFRGWGHKHLYNAEDLTRQLKQAGFEEITRCERNSSTHNELRDRETREDSLLIMEATKQ